MSQDSLDVTQAFADAENCLRDFIGAVLRARLGETWIDDCGVAPEKVAKWRERQAAEHNRQKDGVVENRLLYYADFYDLPTILKKNWEGEFKEALGEWRTVDVWLNELQRLRDPDAHRRSLLPHQKHLIVGISGEIRTRIVRFWSRQETSEGCFPVIESVRDSLGNLYARGDTIMVWTGMTLRVGAVVQYEVTAIDPMGQALEYGVQSGAHEAWQSSNSLTFQFAKADIGVGRQVRIQIRSLRQYHAHNDVDDMVCFEYDLLPPR